MMALRHMSHVLHRTTASLIRCETGIRKIPLNYSNRTFVRSITMASEYVAVEKGTPNSTNYRIFFSEYFYFSFQQKTQIIIEILFHFPRNLMGCFSSKRFFFIAVEAQLYAQFSIEIYSDEILYCETSKWKMCGLAGNYIRQLTHTLDWCMCHHFDYCCVNWFDLEFTWHWT